MDYSVFKPLQALLFFGAALGFGIWQLVAVEREIRKHAQREEDGEQTDEDRVHE